MVYIPGLGSSSWPGGLAGVPGADGSSGSNGYGVSTADGRLTTVSGTPILTSNQLAKTTLYYTPFKGNQIALYSGGVWSVLTFAETSLSLSGYTASRNYDIWGYNNNGVLALESTIWTNDTTRATALTTQNGVYCKTGDTTRRYLGTVRINNTGGQIDWVPGGSGSGGVLARMNVWNVQNRILFRIYLNNTDDSWSQAGGSAWRIAANSSVPHRVDFVQGIQNYVAASYQNRPVFASGNASVGIGLDATNAIAAGSLATNTATSSTMLRGEYNDAPSAGYHYLAPIEYATATVTWYGDNGSTAQQYGMLFTGEF